MNAPEKIVDLLALVCLLFLIPILYYGSRKNVSQAMMIGQAGERFLNTISTAGEITLPVWTEFESAMERFGCTEFQVQRDRYLYEPQEESGSVVKRVFPEQKESLLRQVKEKGRSRLIKGDRIKLTLYVREIPMVYYEWIRTGAVSE